MPRNPSDREPNEIRESREVNVLKVRDPLERIAGEPPPNRPAFKAPTAVPQTLGHLDPTVRRTLVGRLIPRPLPLPPDDVIQNLHALEQEIKRFHGVRVPLYWFPGPLIFSPCADKFGYMFSATVRNASKLPFTLPIQALLGQLASIMSAPGRDAGPDSIIPAGYTYFGQFVDHDITFDTTSTLDSAQDANTITNMRSPALDLDNVYGRGPALDPYIYHFPTGAAPSTAVNMQLGRNQPTGTGGPPNAGGGPGTPTNFDVPRVLAATKTTVSVPDSTFTAIIGDPRNDENLIISQFQHAMLKFHNQVVDLLVSVGFAGDIFAEAKKIVTHHYQWCVVHDFLPRICGQPAVDSAIATVVAPIGSAFRMPVEFSAAAYRFGHSMIRDNYVLNTSLTPAPGGIGTLGNLFAFVRDPNLPVLSNWAVDFNMFFITAHPAPLFNNARPIDTALANGLEHLPGGSGIMAILGTRNLRRGLAFGLPSGQAAAGVFGVAPLTQAQLTSGLPANEAALLTANPILLTQTPLWYYVLREAAVLHGGNQLGPVGARIVAETFVRMLKRNGESFMNVPGFTPTLPSSAPGTFTIADLLNFAGVLVQ